MAGPSYRPAIFFRYITGRFGRGPSVAHPAGFRVEQTFERQLAGDLQLPLLAGKSLMVFRLQTCHSKYATAAIGCEVGIRAVGHNRPVINRSG